MFFSKYFILHHNGWICKLYLCPTLNLEGCFFLYGSEKLGQILKWELGDRVPERSFLVCIIDFPRELDHPNICRFIGVPDVVIVTEYCPKGSLMDVLFNGDIPLNWGFQ